MNTYEENLHNSVTQTLETLLNDAAALQQGHTKAQVTLYHAKGAVLATRDRLDLDQARCEVRRHANRAVQSANNQAQNLLDTLNLAKQGSETTISNVGTTAINLQASADATMQLASTVGATLNIASAAIYNTELFQQLVRINEHLNQVANQARYLALQGMEVSGKCAESIAGALADQGKDVQSRLTDLLAKTSDDLERSMQAVQTDQQQINDAATAEFSAQGVLLDAAARSTAMSSMVREAIRYTNLSLTVDVLSAHRIKVRFSPFKAPFAASAESDGSLAPHVRTYLAIVPQSRASQFTNDQATQLFGKWDGQSPLFVAVQPGENTVELHQDVYGNPVRAGVACCAFLYLEPSAEYKRYLSNYADHISIASTPFVPLTPLPHAIHGGSSGNPRRLLLALSAEGHHDSSAPSEGVASLFSGSAQLEPHLEWLRHEDTKLDHDTATKLNAIVLPFADTLKHAIDALKTDDHRAATASHHEAQKLLRELHTWHDLATHNAAQSKKIAALRTLLEKLGEHIEQACAPSTAKHPKNMRENIELRCILLDHGIDPSITDCATSGKFPDYFNLSIAEQVAPANYIIAERLVEAPKGLVPPASLNGKAHHWYAVDIDDDTTDNFGNLLLPTHSYTPFVLTTTRGTESGEWGNTLSAINYIWQYA